MYSSVDTSNTFCAIYKFLRSSAYEKHVQRVNLEGKQACNLLYLSNDLWQINQSSAFAMLLLRFDDVNEVYLAR